MSIEHLTKLFIETLKKGALLKIMTKMENGIINVVPEYSCSKGVKIHKHFIFQTLNRPLKDFSFFLGGGDEIFIQN